MKITRVSLQSKLDELMSLSTPIPRVNVCSNDISSFRFDCNESRAILINGERTTPPPDNRPPDNNNPGQQQPRTRTIPPPYIYTYTNVNSVSGIELNNYCTISVD